MVFNYEKDIIIDESALDVEWLNQPRLAVKYGINWANKMQELQRAEEDIKLVRADIIKSVNEDPDAFLGEGVKPTGANIESIYRTHEDHIAAKERIISAQYEVNIAEIAKKEISTTRKAALQNLVELHNQQYFAGPSSPRDLSFESQEYERQKRSNNKVASAMRRKR